MAEPTCYKTESRSSTQTVSLIHPLKLSHHPFLFQLNQSGFEPLNLEIWQSVTTMSSFLSIGHKILLTFKVLHGMAPDYLRHLISVLLPSRYNLRRNDDSAALLAFPTIRTKKTLADRSFSCAVARLWNLLPTTIRSTSSLDIFKIRLKTFLFNRAFN